MHAGADQAALVLPDDSYVVENVHPHTMPLLLAKRSAFGQGGAEMRVVEEALVAPGGALGESAYVAPSSDQIKVYTVRAGDTLSQVAELFGVTVNTILWANDLPRSTAIRPDDVLIILPTAGVQHEVIDGDTITSIAKQYDADASEIISFNELDPESTLVVGDQLIVPGGTVVSVQARAARATPVKLSSASVGAFTHPAPNTIRTQGLHGNNGVDFAAAPGTPIVAAAAGEVIVSKHSGWNGGYGQYIVIQHNNGTQTLYAHLSHNAVGVGAWVAKGEVIGDMGNTGRSTGTHLHFEVRGASNPF